MKRLTSLCLALGLALSLAVGARAAASAAIQRAFVYGDTLYTYVDIDGAEAPITKADAEIAGRTFPASGTLETVRQAGFPVTWLLLVDNSNSMPPFREEVSAFAERLAAACGENTRFALASFGDQFTLLEEDVAADALAGAVEAVPMDETVTRLHSSIGAALDYLDGLPRQGSELRCLVVLSDAVQYDPNAAVSYEDLLERINRSGVMVHSVGFGTDAEALESLASLTEASGGSHQVIGDGLSAPDAADAMAEAAGDLYVTGFALSGYAPGAETAEISVTFASGGELVCRASAEAAFPAETAQTPEAETAEGPAVPPSSQSAQGGTASGAAASGAEKKRDLFMTVFTIASAVLVVLTVVVMVVTRRKIRAAMAELPAEEPAADEPEEEGIFLRLDLLEGTYASRTTEFTLRRELVVGRDETCDIPFSDGSVSRRNSRVFLAGGAVYIEDLGSQNGTCVNGERITTARQLRSGDTVSIGDAVFRLRF